MDAYWNALVHYFALSSPYLLVGFAVAGLIHQVLDAERFKTMLSSKKVGPVFWAALMGIPLPLCSCAVIPAAVTLKKSGASNGATSSFLIATPESGVDSIMMTHAMMNPIMAIIRPLAAFITAFSAGVFQLLLKTDADGYVPTKEEASEEPSCPMIPRRGFLAGAVYYAYGKLSNDLAFWLTIGMLLGAFIEVAFPEDFFSTLGPGLDRLGILIIGIPLYICATASTPIVASLVLKGMSPGSALLLLLVGPATNISNIVVLQKYLGKRAVVINVITIAALSLGFSYLVDFFYNFSGLEFTVNISEHHHGSHSPWVHLCSLALAALLLKGIWIEKVMPLLKRKRPSCH